MTVVDRTLLTWCRSRRLAATLDDMDDSRLRDAVAAFNATFDGPTTR